MRSLLMFLVCLGLVVGATAAPTKAKPKKARLKAAILEKARPFNYLLPEGREAAETQNALVGTVARRRLLLVDVDGDGRFDEEGVDGWALGNYLYLMPYEQPFIFGNILVSVSLQENKKSLLWTTKRMPGGRSGWSDVARINGVRMRNGLTPVSVSAELSKGCRLHCLYMARHGISHNEDPSKPGYTEAGAKAGHASNIAFSSFAAGAGAFRQFFHRRTIARPETRTMGFGMLGDTSCVDGLSDRTPRPWKYPIIIPAPNSTHQTISFDHGESPPAVPQAPPAGMPITLRWERGTSVTNVNAKIHDAKGKRIQAHLSSPEKPAHASVPDNNDSICLIPRTVLKPGATYHVAVKAVVEGKPYERKFEFKTSKRTKR